MLYGMSIRKLIVADIEDAALREELVEMFQLNNGAIQKIDAVLMVQPQAAYEERMRREEYIRVHRETVTAELQELNERIEEIVQKTGKHNPNVQVLGGHVDAARHAVQVDKSGKLPSGLTVRE
jgi:hypothetical protein